MASLPDNAGSQSSVGDTARLSLRQLNGPAIFALLLVAFAFIVALWSTWPLLVDAWRGAPKKLSSVENSEEVQTRRNEAFDGYLAQITGRSLFHVPPPPKAPEPDKPVEVDPDKPPPPPTSYGGPAIIAMLSDTVWFAGGKKMKLGDKEDDLEIVSLSPPWMGKLRWKGVDFDVGLFEKSNMLKENKTDESSDASQTPKEETTPTDEPTPKDESTPKDEPTPPKDVAPKDTPEKPPEPTTPPATPPSTEPTPKPAEPDSPTPPSTSPSPTPTPTPSPSYSLSVYF